jgi:hypothetical protein
MPGEPVFLIVTEDGASDAHRVIEALFRAMCRLMIQGFADQRLGRHCFAPADENLRRAISGNKWKSTSVRDQGHITDLAQHIAAHLVQPDAFVLLHFDGDRPYGQRAFSESVLKFQECLLAKVEAVLANTWASRTRSTVARRPLGPDEVAAALGRLLCLTPYYCIEAWTYYNTRKLREICRAHEHALIERWEQDPGATEELECPWRMISAAKEHNLPLVERGFPGRVALEAGRSFADTVRQLQGNGALMSALAPLVHPGYEYGP